VPVALLAADKAIDLCDKRLQGCLNSGLIVGEFDHPGPQGGLILGELDDPGPQGGLIVGERHDPGIRVNYPGPHLQLHFFQSDLVLTKEPLVVAQDADRRGEVSQNAFDVGQALFVIHGIALLPPNYTDRVKISAHWRRARVQSRANQLPTNGTTEARLKPCPDTLTSAHGQLN
jgi:hypothetical protein